MTDRIFMFHSVVKDNKTRPRLYAFRESEIKTIESQVGSTNCYLVVNGIEVQGSFEQLVSALGVKVDIR